MGRLTTHVLDTSSGRPGAGIRVEVYTFASGQRPLSSLVTNADGRCDSALVEGEDFKAGDYKLVFHAGDYFRESAGLEPDFLDTVVLRFKVSNPAEDYHVPLLLSPYGYSTYRGS